MTDTFRKEYKPLTPEQNGLIDEVKEAAQVLYDTIGKAESVGTAGETITLSKQKVQEAVFWAVHGITA